MKTLAAFLISAGAATGVQALQLELPATAQLSASSNTVSDSFSLAVSPWRDGRLEAVVAEGAVSRQAWVLPGSSLTTLQMIEPLRDGVQAVGYRILFECRDRDCGGFDFRYSLPLLPEPDMHVDLGDYRYFVAEKPDAPQADKIAVVTSRSASSGYIHITRVGPEADGAAQPVVAAPEPEAAPAPAPLTSAPLADQLVANGRAVLEDLVFETGSADLGNGAFPSLVALAYLRANPEVQVVLVGHTDAEGALDSNVALSLRRAQSVANRLTEAFGVAPEQVRAEGVGYLAPRATNATEEGRAQNRRVEVIKTVTE